MLRRGHACAARTGDAVRLGPSAPSSSSLRLPFSSACRFRFARLDKSCERHTALLAQALSNDGSREVFLMALRHIGAAAALAVSIGFGASPALAVTEIQWWHAMTGANNDVIVKLANDFNAAQT